MATLPKFGITTTGVVKMGITIVVGEPKAKGNLVVGDTRSVKHMPKFAALWSWKLAHVAVRSALKDKLFQLVGAVTRGHVISKWDAALGALTPLYSQLHCKFYTVNCSLLYLLHCLI